MTAAVATDPRHQPLGTTRQEQPTSFTGTPTLIRLALRRDRIWLAPWIIGIAALAAGTASSIADLFPTEASRLAIAETARTNPALLALVGPGGDLRTLGGLTSWRLGVLATVAVALMNIFLVVRHTRADEESARTELVGSLPVGRRAGLAAALVVALIADAIMTLAMTAGLLAGGLDLGPSALFSVAVCLGGVTFAGVAAVSAQCATTARAASGGAAAILGMFFLIRAAGDIGGNGLVWASPLGWVSKVAAYGDSRTWVLLLWVGVTAATTAVAFEVSARREYGAGLFPARAGRAAASAVLSGPIGLATRLQRGALLGWGLGLAATGAAFGAITRDVASLVEGNAALEEAIGQIGGADGLVEAYLGTALGMTALAVAGYLVSAVLRVRTEESAGLAESVLAAPLPRARWGSAHPLVGAVGSVLLLLVVGGTLAGTSALRGGAGGVGAGETAVAALAQAPAIWVLGALGLALIGWLPRAAAALTWAALAVAVVLGLFGELLQLPQGLIDVSPFAHTPGVGAVSAGPLLILTGMALALTVFGLVGLTRRNIG